MSQKFHSRVGSMLVAVTLTLALFLVGCSKNVLPNVAKSQPAQPPANNPVPNPNPQPNPYQGGDVLAGSWVSGCVPTDPGEQPDNSKVVTWTFSGNGNMTANIQYYSDSNCTQADTTLPLSGTYVIGSGVNADGSQNLDYVLNGTNIYEIFRVADGYLYLGDDTGANDATTPDTRPNTLWTAPSYSKQ